MLIFKQMANVVLPQVNAKFSTGPLLPAGSGLLESGSRTGAGAALTQWEVDKVSQELSTRAPASELPHTAPDSLFPLRNCVCVRGGSGSERSMAWCPLCPSANPTKLVLAP